MFHTQLSEKCGFAQCVLNNRILDIHKDLFDAFSIGGLSEMWIDGQLSAIELREAPEDVACGLLHIGTTCIFGEVLFQRSTLDLLAEDVHFVEEEDDRRAGKPA